MSAVAPYADFALAYEGRAKAIATAKKQEDVAFAHALVAIAAKLATCDGKADRAEYLAFQSLFIAQDDTDGARLKSLFVKHTHDKSGAMQYARQIAAATPGQTKLHEELLSRLLRIANADAMLNAAELEFLRATAKVFGIEGEAFRAIISRGVVPTTASPYMRLGISEDASDTQIRNHYMTLARRLHPDRYQAAGASAETIAMLSDQLAQLNAAYEAVKKLRARKLSHWLGRKNTKGAKASA